MTRVVRAAPLREQVVERVFAELLAGRFAPGERITEFGVAELLSVSRTPAREALALLAERGVLERRRTGGYLVPDLTAKTLAAHFELRRLLEPYAARSLADTLTAAQLARLDAALRDLRRAVDSDSAVQAMQANLALRNAMFDGLENDALRRAIAAVTDTVQLVGALTLSTPRVRRLLLTKRERVIGALGARDGEAVLAAMQDYLDASRDCALAALPSAGARAPRAARRRAA